MKDQDRITSWSRTSSLAKTMQDRERDTENEGGVCLLLIRRRGEKREDVGCERRELRGVFGGGGEVGKARYRGNRGTMDDMVLVLDVITAMEVGASQLAPVGCADRLQHRPDADAGRQAQTNQKQKQTTLNNEIGLDLDWDKHRIQYDGVEVSPPYGVRYLAITDGNRRCATVVGTEHRWQMLHAKPVTVENVTAMRVSMRVYWPKGSFVGRYLKPCAIRTCPSALGGLFSLPWSVGPGHELCVGSAQALQVTMS